MSKTGLMLGTKTAAAIFGISLLGVTIGCAGDASSDESLENDEVGQLTRDLGFRGLCGGFRQHECRHDDDVCLPFVARGCPGPRRLGLCLPRPRHCPPITHPVCGCDGNTYNNICEALRAGVSIEHRGECSDTGEPLCGGAAGMECAGAAMCVDDPDDACDPASGDDDCPGACECNLILPCGPGMQFDNDPTVCECVPEDPTEPDPCARIICPIGEECVVVDDGSPACQPTP